MSASSPDVQGGATADTAHAGHQAARSQLIEATRALAAALARGPAKPLHYATDDEPGIRRRRQGSGFTYWYPDGRRVTDAEEILRIRSLAIPPAYKNVWICLSPEGHLQATGIDARGRKQYRYHPQWRAVRDADKFGRMAAFGRALPRIRRKVARDTGLPGMPREKVIATVVRLLDRTLIRVGNDQYARENHSYGLTTLRNRHVAVSGNVLHFEFRGKHGILHRVTVSDPQAAAVVRRCLDLPGQELFQYVDAEGRRHDVSSSDVNMYLKEAAGEDFTAKDFRTWHATAMAVEALTQRRFATATEAKRHVKEVMQAVASQLGNTPAMCRKCYVHPGVVDRFLAGKLAQNQAGRRSGRAHLLQLLQRLSISAGRVPPAGEASRNRRAAARSRDRRHH